MTAEKIEQTNQQLFDELYILVKTSCEVGIPEDKKKRVNEIGDELNRRGITERMIEKELDFQYNSELTGKAFRRVFP